MKQELKYRHHEETKTIITYVNTTSKAYLFSNWDTKWSKSQNANKKLIQKHNLLNNVQDNVDAIFNKVKDFKEKIVDFF